MNIVEAIVRENERRGECLAVIDGAERVTYGTLLAAVEAARRDLAAAGVLPGQRIAFWCRDGVDYLVGALALLAAGAAVVPFPDPLPAAERETIAGRMDVHGLLLQEALADGPAGVAVASLGGRRFRWCSRSLGAPDDGRCRDLGAAFIRFSSGTTGQSKGVVLSHRTILERTAAADRGLQIRTEDVVLWVLGMSHHFVVSILLFLRRGATIVVAARPFPFAMFAAVAEHPVTVLYAAPLHYRLMAASAAVAGHALAHVWLAVSTAMGLSPEIRQAFARKFGIVPAEAYGIIEVGLPCIDLQPDLAEPGAVGRILPDYGLRLDAPDADGIGEVLLRGPGLFDAYASPWRWRDEVLDHGWFRTGDLGRLTPDGRLVLVGRRKNVIVHAGMKVFPEEVEAVLMRHPAVREALVQGLADEACGQVPVASDEPVPGHGLPDLPEALRRHCRDALAAEKIPVRVDIVDALPRTPSGKPRRTP